MELSFSFVIIVIIIFLLLIVVIRSKTNKENMMFENSLNSLNATPCGVTLNAIDSKYNNCMYNSMYYTDNTFENTRNIV